MAKSLTLSGAFVRHAALAISNRDGAKTVRVDFTFNWTAAVRKALGWSDVEKDQTAVDLTGELSVMTINLEVNDRTFNLGSGILKNPRAVRVFDDNGKKSTIELRAQYVTHSEQVIATVESYVETASRARGSLKISYDLVRQGEAEDPQQEAFAAAAE